MSSVKVSDGPKGPASPLWRALGMLLTTPVGSTQPAWLPLESKACRSTSLLALHETVARTTGAGAGSWTGVSFFFLHFFFFADPAERLCLLQLFFAPTAW